jgi:pyridine nucleotide-disulfide oxidoreductase family protein
VKRLILAGGGHAHVHVLRDLARAGLAGAEVLLVSPHARQLYSGMVPGLVAGHYGAGQCSIPLPPLAQAAGVRLLQDTVQRLDAAAGTIELASGQRLTYDVLSLDTGAVIDRDRLPGAREHGLFLRPIEHFVRLLDPLLALARERVLDVVLVGGGAAGVEVAMALQHRLAGQGDERARVALVSGGPPPLFGYPQAVIDRGLRALSQRRITVLHDSATAIEAGAVHLANGARLACDAPVIATGADAPPYLQGSGLQLDERGFVLTGPTLQSLSHPQVLAVGDVASRSDAPHPRSGVYAVRAGPPLAHNLRCLVDGAALRTHQPQARTLNLLSCGNRRAIASYGLWSAQGRWVWWWKDRIDRGFVARYGGGGMPDGVPE